MHASEGETRDPKTDSGGHKSKRHSIRDRQLANALQRCRICWTLCATESAPYAFLQSQQIGQPIGHGQFATVHKAMHILTAVKTFEATKISKSTMSQILAEADLLKGLQHHNIVRFIECAKKKHKLHIVMEYVEEGSIAQLLDEFGCLPESVCGVYVPQILQGLDYLHSRNVFHRDIKGGGIKLSDFGVSALATESEKRLSVVGTPYWIPPEVINLDGWRPTSDVWSLGCTIIEMITGSPPHDGMNTMAAMYKIVEEEMPIPEEGPTDALKDFLKNCFVKNPAARPTAAKLLTHTWIPQQPATEDLSLTRQRIRVQAQRIEEAKTSDILDPESQSYLKLRNSIRPGRRGGSQISSPILTARAAAEREREKAQSPRSSQPGAQVPALTPSGTSGDVSQKKADSPKDKEKEKARSPRSSQPNAQDNTNESAATAVPQPLAADPIQKIKSGWLLVGRDKKRGWFLLQKSIFYWFSKEQERSIDRKDIQGVLKLIFYNVTVTSDTSFEIQDFLPAVAPEEEPKGGVKKLTWDDIVQPPSSVVTRRFNFTCKSKEELLLWMHALQDDILRHRKWVNAGAEHFGWLKLKDGKGNRRCFCYLRRKRLSWYKTSEDWTEMEKGAVSLSQCQLRRDLDARMLVISNSNNSGLTVTLTAEKEEDFQKWSAVLEKAIEVSARQAELAKARNIEWDPAVKTTDSAAPPVTVSPREKRSVGGREQLEMGSKSPRATSPSRRGHVRKESKDGEAMQKIASAPASTSLRSSSPPIPPPMSVSASALPASPLKTSSGALSNSPSTSSSRSANVASPENLQKMWSKAEETVLENQRLRKRNDELEMELRSVRAERDQLRVTNSEISAALDEISSLAAWLANADSTPPAAAANVADMRRQLKQALNELKIKNLKKRATERRLGGLMSPPKERGSQG